MKPVREQLHSTEQPTYFVGVLDCYAVYDEYARSFDDIPILQDAVRAPPLLRPPPDFRSGERRDERGEPRPDAYSVRESSLIEIEGFYAEYCGSELSATRPKRPRRKGGARKTRRTGQAARAKTGTPR